MTATLVVISGCSGGGKSTLLAELRRHGHRVFEEPGRQLVREELASGGDALPWANAELFLERCIAVALDQHAEALQHDGLSFFDRSVIDALNGFQRIRKQVPHRFRGAVADLRYHRSVFMTPPWPEIYATDNERRHDFEEGVAEYERLLISYRARGYETSIVPKLPVPARADFVLARLRDHLAVAGTG